MNENTRRPETVEQLRDDIDHGRTGDKVPVGDPAAAPLGADDEAAGTSTPVQREPRVEQRPNPGPVKAHSLSSEGGRTTRVTMVAVLGVAAALVLAALVAL